MKKRFGFTLAEVLITLGIIGVISMMVLPSIKGETEKIVTIARLKHSYSVLQNAIRMSEYHNGKIKRWQIMSGDKFFHKYIQNYLKYSTEYSKEQLLSMNITRTLLNGKKYVGSTFATSYGGSHSYSFMLLDGSMVTFNQNGSDTKGMWVGIDINGFEPPNRIGRDSFLFYLSLSDGLQPLGGPGTPTEYGGQWNYIQYVEDGKTVRDVITDSKYSTSCSLDAADLNASGYSQAGYWCTALIMNDGWKISKDYPWNKVKKH